MLRHEVERLQSVHGYPAVSILAPTGRNASGNTQNPIRVKSLVQEAEKRLKEHNRGADVEPIIERLEDLARRVDYDHALDGLALFANRDTSELVYLPFEVNERVVVDETFATRDLVYALRRGPRYFVLSLDTDVCRLYEGVRDSLEEVTLDGLPMTRESARGEISLISGGGTQDSVYEDDADRQYLRHVDAALDRVLARDFIPVAIMGDDRVARLFREVTHHSEQIISSITGHGKTPDRQIAHALYPRLEEIQKKKKAEAMERLSGAISGHVAAFELPDIWTAALDGRVFMLIVEEGYRQPGRTDESGRTLTLADDRGGDGVIDDAVNQVVEMVAQKDGQIVFVEDGTLPNRAHIAAVLRF